jgi:hypothetical protein
VGIRLFSHCLKSHAIGSTSSTSLKVPFKGNTNLNVTLEGGGSAKPEMLAYIHVGVSQPRLESISTPPSVYSDSPPGDGPSLTRLSMMVTTNPRLFTILDNTLAE